ncbi:MAG: hypothetical protein ABIP51_17855 [Bacteroidia bacterium]
MLTIEEIKDLGYFFVSKGFSKPDVYRFCFLKRDSEILFLTKNKCKLSKGDTKKEIKMLDFLTTKRFICNFFEIYNTYTNFEEFYDKQMGV